MSKTTTRALLPYPEDADAPDGPTQIKALAERGDVLANYAGATNAKQAIIDTEQTRESASYGLMTTPDRVQGIVVPEGGLIVVAFQAIWKTAGASIGRAALFVNENQLKVNVPHATTPIYAKEEASHVDSEGAKWNLLNSFPLGLASVANLTASIGAFPTTGLAHSPGWKASNNMTFRLEEEGVVTNVLGQPGLCVISNLAAGTYEIGVRFKTSSGAAVTVKERRLHVWTREFA